MSRTTAGSAPAGDGENVLAQYHHGIDGKLLRTWGGHQINDLALTADGQYLLATPANGQVVRLYALQAGVEREIAAPSAIISIALASDSRHLLVRLCRPRLRPCSTGPVPSGPFIKRHALHI